MKVFLAVFATVLMFCSVAPLENEHRLPTSVIPTFYELRLNIYVKEMNFKASAVITVDIVEQTSNITLHALNLEIKSLAVYRMIGDVEDHIEHLESYPFEDYQFYIIKFVVNLPVGVYKIRIEYDGVFDTDFNGLYAADYRENQFARPKPVVVANFKTMHARKVFPCFEEPGLTANFSISITRDKRHIVLANMPVKYSASNTEGRITDTFMTTPKLPTYQIAFVICDFVKTPYERGNIYTSPSHSPLRQMYLSDISLDLFKAIERYLDMPLPQEKIDITTVRHLSGKDGGIGSWGLIVFSEDKLYNSDVNRTIEEQDSLLTVAHVYLHQIFGGLVTPVWWNYLWMNEGIATYIQYWIADQIKPEWRLLEQRNLKIIREAVEKDLSVTSRAISAKGHEIYYYSDHFDAATYQKGAAVMMTLENTIGSDTFRKGLRRFIYSYLGRSVTPNDLWNAMQNSTDTSKTFRWPDEPIIIRNLVEIMESWENSDGVLVLNSTRNYTRPYTTLFRMLRLEEYVNSNLPVTWHIPINTVTEKRPVFNNLRASVIYKPGSTFHGFTDANINEWYIINAQASYYYLVNYDETNWKRLANALNSENFGHIAPVTRGKLLYDAFTLARCGYLRYDVALELIKYLDKERDYIVLETFFYVFDYFYSRFSGLQNFHYIETFVANALEPTLRHLGFKENQTTTSEKQHLNNLNRIQVIKWACLLGNKFCRNSTTQMLKEEWEIYTLSSELREAVVCGGLIEAEEKLWQSYYNKIQHEDQKLDIDISKGLRCSQNNNSLNNYIERTLKYNISVFHEIYPRGPFGIDFILKYLIRRGKLVYESLRKDEVLNVFRGVGKYISTDRQLDMLYNVSVSLHLARLGSMYGSPSAIISEAEKKVNFVKSRSNEVNRWIQKEFMSKATTTARVSLCVVIVLSFLFSSLF